MTRYHLAAVSDSTLFSGAERALEILIGALPPDVHVTVVGTDGAVIHRLAAARPGVQAVLAPPKMRILRRVFRQVAPDIVHMNLASTRSCRSAMGACFSLRLPVVLVDHLPVPGLRLRGQLLQRMITGLSAARVSVGLRSSQLVESIIGLPTGAVLTVHNGVPPPDAQPPPPLEGVLRVAAIGRLVRQKGVDVLLRAMVEVPQVRLTIAGTGALESDLRRIVTQLGLDHRVDFVGWVDAASIFRQVDAVALPSRNEGLPLVLLEAMHVGLPVIATWVGSVAEAIEDGKTGLLVPPEDPLALARALNHLAEFPTHRKRLGAAARRRAQQDFSPAAMANGYDTIYSAVLSTAPRTGFGGSR
jgi:glycosyltransferase involved in cell wall biosynthesis